MQRQFTQELCLIAEGVKLFQRRLRQVVKDRARAVEPPGADIRTFVLFSVLAERLAHLILRARHIEDVVGDLEWNIDYSTAWMQGYLYNYDNNSTECFDNEDWLISSPVSLTGVQHAKMVMTYIGRYFNSFGINNGVTIWVSTNYHYGDMPSMAMWTQIPASLEQGVNWTDFYIAELSLDNYIGQTVTVAVKYISNTETAGNIEIQSISIEEGVPYIPAGQIIYFETFASGQGSFTIQDVVLPAELTYIWAHAANYSCMKASAYVSQAYESESWLVSPSINLSNVDSAVLKFDHTAKYASPLYDYLYVMISTNYYGNVSTATWHELTLSQWPSGNDWTFVNSTTDISSYVGQNVTIAFKYTSSSSVSPTWELKNFIVEE